MKQEKVECEHNKSIGTHVFRRYGVTTRKFFCRECSAYLDNIFVKDDNEIPAIQKPVMIELRGLLIALNKIVFITELRTYGNHFAFYIYTMLTEVDEGTGDGGFVSELYDTEEQGQAARKEFIEKYFRVIK